MCIEDLDQFGGIPYDSSPPYFSLDASCSISNIREVVSSNLFFCNSKFSGSLHDNLQHCYFHIPFLNSVN